MIKLRTINDIFFAIAASDRPKAILVQAQGGNWEPISSATFYQRVLAVARALSEWGIGKGARVAILAENRWEWAVADFATLALGAVDVPIYPTLLAEQIAALLADSGARVIFVSTQAQYDKIASIRARTAIERIVVMDQASTPDGIAFSSLLEKIGRAHV